MKNVLIGDRKLDIVGVAADDIYYSLIADGLESDFHKLCTQYLNNTSICLDIGANIGVITSIMSERAKSVYSFEPSRKVFEALSANVANNNLSNVSVFNVAVSDQQGTAKFFENSAWGYLSANGPGSYDIKVTTIDEIVADLKLDRLDFIKIDVEGNEWSVLRGATQTIKRFDPIIYLEFNSWVQVAHSKVNPLEFASWIFDSFKYVGVFNAGADGWADRVSEPTMFAHDNMVRHHCNQDLIISNDPDWATSKKIAVSGSATATIRKLTEEVLLMRADLDHVSSLLRASEAENRKLLEEGDALRTRLDKVYTSSSWRMTAPIRYLRRLLG